MTSSSSAPPISDADMSLLPPPPRPSKSRKLILSSASASKTSAKEIVVGEQTAELVRVRNVYAKAS